MSAKNLSTVANDLIESYGNTAKNVINAYRTGGERMVEALAPDGVRATVMRQRLGAFNKRLGDLVDAVNAAYKASEPEAAGAAPRPIEAIDRPPLTGQGEPVPAPAGVAAGGVAAAGRRWRTGPPRRRWSRGSRWRWWR